MATETNAQAPTHTEASSDRGPELQDKVENAGEVPLNDDKSAETSGREDDSDEREEGETDDDEVAPPLPEGEEPPPPPEGETPPPLPDEAPPDDGWDALWDDTHLAYYFYNRLTGVTTWENPRVPEVASTAPVPDSQSQTPVAGGYNPAIHGDYDPNADYAIEARAAEAAVAAAADAQAQGLQPSVPDYAATGMFNRFTGKWQAADQNPDRHGDEAKSKRQMNAFFDVDAAANNHGGKSLKAERQNKKLSKAELKAFKEKRRDKKEEKRRAWLRD